MVNRLLELRVNIYVVCNSMVNRTNRSLVNLIDAQWALLEDVGKIPKPFMLAQELLEGEKYVTLSRTGPWKKTLESTEGFKRHEEK